jgi:uncharacterized protein (TIGR01777 family)
MEGGVLLTGGTGLIGGRFLESLGPSSRPIRCLTRTPAKAALETGIEILAWDGRELPAQALQGCSAVVHLAGEPVFGGLPTAARREAIRASRVDSTRSIVSALREMPSEQRPATFVCASAVGVYGARGEQTLDETAEPGSGFLAEVCRQWETAARAAEESNVRVVVLRTGIVLAKRGGALPMMALPFRLGVGGRTGSGTQWVPWIHVDDVVRMIAAILDDDRWRGPVNAVAPNPVRNSQLSTALAQTLRRPSWLPVPEFALRVALGEMSNELLGSRRCIPQCALDLGFEFTHTEVETALAAELT